MIHFLCIYNHSVVSKSSGSSLANLKCPILLPQLLEYWNYRPVPPHLSWFMCVKNLHMVNHQQCGRVSLFQHRASISHFSSFLWVSMTRVRWSVMGLILIPFVISSRSIFTDLFTICASSEECLLRSFVPFPPLYFFYIYLLVVLRLNQKPLVY